MPFKKLHPTIKEKLTEMEITTPTPLQTKAIPAIKSGANVFCTAPKGSGKTTTLILTTLHKLKFESVGEAPRAIVLVEDKDRALELQEAFASYMSYNAMRVYAGYDQLHVDVQKSEIFMGVDILIATPKSLNKLFLANGVGTSQLMILSIDDADFLMQKTSFDAVMAISQNIKKCQYVLYSEKMNPKIKRFENYFMEYAKHLNG